MKFINTDIEGIIIIEPSIFRDDRGYFFESYNEAEFKKNGINVIFVQDNQSKSCYGVIRGLHCQLGAHSQAKLVRVLDGKVMDIAVDMRKDSSTYGKHTSIELSSESGRQLFIPKGFLHGFSVLSETAVLTYKCDDFYDKESEFGVRYDDVDLGIDWKINVKDVIVSDKDKKNWSFKDAFNHRF